MLRHVAAEVLLGHREIALVDLDAVDPGDHRIGLRPSGAAVAHNGAVTVSAQETMRRVAAMKRKRFGKGAKSPVIVERSDLGANRSGLVRFGRAS